MIARRKIVILLGSPFTAQNFERVGLPYLAPYFEVLVLDCAYLIGRRPDAISIRMASWDNYRVVKTQPELEHALREFAPVFALDDIGLGLETRCIVEVVMRCSVRLVALKTGVMPQPTLCNKLQAFVRRSRADTASIDVLGQLTLPVPKFPVGRLNQLKNLFILGVRKAKRELWDKPRMPGPDVSLVAGCHALDWMAKKSAHILWVGSEDYHLFKKAESQLQNGELPKREYAYALFVDVCLPYATDWKFLNLPPPISAAEYYPLLCAFFDRMEVELGMPVLVAGHPNSKALENYSQLVGGREVLFDQTAALVRQSRVMLTHASTATSFAVLARKPILFITSKQLEKTGYGKSIRAMSNTLGGRLVYMEGSLPQAQEATDDVIDEIRYARYEQSFLKNHQSSETRPWGAFIEYATVDEID